MMTQVNCPEECKFNKDGLCSKAEITLIETEDQDYRYAYCDSYMYPGSYEAK